MKPWMIETLASLYALVEWWLPRTDKIQARSVLEIVANVLRLIPGVGVVLNKVGTPPPPATVVTAIAKEVVPVPPAVPPAAMLIFWLAGCMSLSGCATAMTSYYKGVATAAVVIGSGYRLLDKRDADVQGEITQLATTDAIAAEARFKQHLEGYRIARKVLDDASIVVATAKTAGPTIEAAVNRNTEIAGWIARLTSLVASVTGSLSAFGAK